MRALLLAALASMALVPPLDAESAIGNLELLGLVTIPAGSEIEGTPLGGLSGITYDPELDRYYAISDDPSNRSPARFYTLTIDLTGGRLEAGGVEIEGATVLTDPSGQPFAKRVIDGEGIALTPERTLLISSEGNIRHGVPPSIREFDLDGGELREYRLPKKFLAKKRKPWGTRHNTAFEALTWHPSGQAFVTATENALVQDGPEADLDQSSPVRISRFQFESGKLEADHVYLVEPVAEPPADEDGFRTNGLVELIALGNGEFLALERSFSAGVGNVVRLFLVSIDDADNVRRRKRLDGRKKVATASKRLLLDFGDLGVAPDNLEGMTFGPRLADGRRSLIVLSDDNFNESQTTQIFAFAVGDGETPIAAIQGAGQRSPLEGAWLAEVRGVVTAVDLESRRNGFWMQAESDGDDATSDGLFVSPVSSGLSVAIGDRISIHGRIVETEFPQTLPVTRLEPARIDVLSQRAPLPEPVDLGANGRVVPPRVDDDGLRSFEPAEDAIDFYESLEGMLVRIDQAVVVGPTTRFGTLTVAIDGGDGVRTSRGGLLLGPNDPNAERLIVDTSLLDSAPDAEVGQRLAAPLTGVLDYAFGSFRLVATEPIRLAEHEDPLVNHTFVIEADRLRVMTYNVWNLDPGDPLPRFQDLGGQIGTYRSHIIALQEIQDDSGNADDGTVSAARTLGKLIDAAVFHHGPRYEAVQIDPENNADGGAPGGNIRVVFLYDPEQVSLVDEGSRLGERNPVRLFETHPAFLENEETGFAATRKPLAAEFELDGHRIVAINVHLKSKRGDDRLFGSRQPPVRATETQRTAQARAIGEYVASLLADDPQALVMVLGDFNELEYRAPMLLFGQYGLTNLTERIDKSDRYTFNFEGNSQALDHILVSPALARGARTVDVFRLNADQPHTIRDSDHDAVVATFDLGSSVE